MKTQIYLLLFALSCLLSSCAPSGYIPSSKGDYTEITLLKDKVAFGELLAVTDTMIFIEKDRNIIAIRNRNLKQLYFDKYHDNSWILSVALMEVLPALVFSITASSYNAADGDFLPVFLASLIPAAISTPLFLLSAPKTTFDDLSNESEIYELKKFSRYPGGITERQLKDLLNYNGQDSLIYLK